MTGGLFAKLRASIAAAAAATRAAFERRTQRKPPPPPAESLRFAWPSPARPKTRRPDATRQAMAQAKRDRKNSKRLRDWLRCYVYDRCSTGGPHTNRWIIHGS